MGTFRTTIIDFETTGLSPDYGDRIIEVGTNQMLKSAPTMASTMRVIFPNCM